MTCRDALPRTHGSNCLSITCVSLWYARILHSHNMGIASQYKVCEPNLRVYHICLISVFSDTMTKPGCSIYGSMAFIPAFMVAKRYKLYMKAGKLKVPNIESL